MGQQAKLKASRRGARSRDKDRLRALDEQALEDPAWAATKAEFAADTEAQAILARDLPGQHERLAAAGWVRRLAATDGAGMWDHRRREQRIIHSLHRYGDGHVWAHVSLSNRDRTLPGWYDVRDAGWLLYPGRAGVIVVAPQGEHYSEAEIHHVWYCLTAPSVPDLKIHGGI